MEIADILCGGWFTDLLQTAEEIKVDSNGNKPQSRSLAEAGREVSMTMRKDNHQG